MNTEIQVGSQVTLNVDQEEIFGTVTKISRGWYLIDTEEGTTVSRRVNQINLVEDEEAEEEEAEEGAICKMTEQLNKARARYVKVKCFSGKASLSNGDAVAKILEGLSPSVVRNMAESLCSLEVGTLEAKYANLKAGAIRMNSANRIRGALKQGFITLADVERTARLMG